MSQTGSRDPRRQPNQSFRYVDIAAVDNKTKRIVDPNLLAGKDAPSRARQVMKYGDVIVSMTRPNLNAVALVSRDLDDEICSTGFAILRSKPCVLPEYIFHYVRTSTFITKTTSAVSGALYPAITASFLRSLPIPLPPLDEQRRIVSLLDRAAEIRRRADAARTKARAIIPALFLDMFGDSAPEWPNVTIGDILANQQSAMRTGPFGSQLKHSEFTDKGVPVLGIDNVVHNEFKWAKPRYISTNRYDQFRRFRVFPGDVIVTIMGTTGRVCVAPDDLPACMNTKHLCAFTLNQSRAHPRFIWAALLFDPSVRSQARSKANGQIMEGWNMGIVRSMSLPLPPLPHQTAFAEQAQRLEATARALDAAAAKAEAMASALSAEVFG